MGYFLKLTIQGLPKTLNAIGRKNYWIKCKEANFWKNEVANSVKTLPDNPLEKFTLKLTRHSSSEPDYDGLVSSFKHIVDGLMFAGVIDNDRLSNTGQWDCQWEKTPRNKGYVTVEVKSDME